MRRQPKRPVCRWCAKPLAAHYTRICEECGHWARSHAKSESSVPNTCKGHTFSGPPMTCGCLVVFGWGPSTSPEERQRRKEQFQLQLMGFGWKALNLFCSQDCASRWAHEHARHAYARPSGI